MKNPMALLAGLLLIMTPGCSYIKVADYSGFCNIGEDGMLQGWEYELSPTEGDSTLDLSGTYDVVIAVRYTNSCPSQSVIFNIEEFSLAQERPDSVTITIPLFDGDGEPVGRSRFGIIETSDTIRRDFRVPDGYSLSLSTPLPSSATVGIKAVGMVLVDRSQKKPLFKIKL